GITSPAPRRRVPADVEVGDSVICVSPVKLLAEFDSTRMPRLAADAAPVRNVPFPVIGPVIVVCPAQLPQSRMSTVPVNATGPDHTTLVIVVDSVAGLVPLGPPFNV